LKLYTGLREIHLDFSARNVEEEVEKSAKFEMHYTIL
jgi:hypothetical protein